MEHLDITANEIPPNIMSDSVRKKFTDAFSRQNVIAETGKSNSCLK